MRATRLMAVMMGLTVAFAVAAEAAPLTLTLQRTTVLYNEDPPGAPLPLGRIQRDAGDVLVEGRKIGEYLWIKDVHAEGFNNSAVTLTLFLTSATGGPPIPITLMGSHDFTTGNGMGSVSASAIPSLVGIVYTTNATTDTLTLYFP